MLVGLGVELRGRDGGHAEFRQKEPAEFEVARAVGDVRGERVGVRKADFGEVGEDEVATFGFGVLCFFGWGG